LSGASIAAAPAAALARLFFEDFVCFPKDDYFVIDQRAQRTFPMKTHVQIVAALNIAAGALYLLVAFFLFVFIGMAGGIVASQGEHAVAGILGIITVALCGFLAVLALPSIIAGWGLFAGKSWARVLTLVLAFLHLPNIPFGTALGIYTLWVLLHEEPRTQLPAQSVQPVA
jgi:hypothetical protein